MIYMNTHMTHDANQRAIAAYLAHGEDNRDDFYLGLELEHFVVEQETYAPIPYEGDKMSGRPGVEDMLERIAPYYDRQVYEPQEGGPERLIGLMRDKTNITLEPGAQLEISIGPARCVSDIEHVYNAFREELDPILQEYGYLLLEMGYHPLSCSCEIALIPKKRYTFMDEYFKTTGRHGICMMRGSASTQVSIDYEDEEDCVRKFKIANALGPLFAFITDNSPVFEGTPVGSLSSDNNLPAAVSSMLSSVPCSGLPVPERMARTVIWDDVDPLRSMTAPAALDDDFGYFSYAEGILKAPAILTVEQVANAPESANEPQGTTHNIFTGSTPIDEIYAEKTLDHHTVEHLLSMFFFDVRLKQYIEIRMADAMPLPYALAYTALIKGIFYSDRALEQLEEAFRFIDPASIAFAKSALRREGYAASVYGRNATEWFDLLIGLARDGLENPTFPAPEKRTCDGQDELLYLAPLERLVAQRTTLLDAYNSVT